MVEYGGETLPLKTRFAPERAVSARVQASISQAAVHFVDQHAAVAAPSIETYPVVHEMASSGSASVDVEAGSIARAVLELEAEGIDVTFTPVYTHSDDPRRSEEDRFESWAMQAPLFEGSRYDAKLFGVLTSLAGYID